MTNTWIISDTHFDHGNIIGYCNRPFETVEDMNNTMIKTWNMKVRKDDIVYHLGDFCFGGRDVISKIVSQLNGKIHLIKGNHDCNSNQFYRDCGFVEVYDNPIIIRDFIVLSHEPQPFVMNQMYVNLYGHVHDSPMYDTWKRNSVCMCVERHYYAPVKLDDILHYFNPISY